MSGGAGEDDNSVMTGMTGATGTHSMSSAATAQAKNNMMAAAQRAPMNVGSGEDSFANTTTTNTVGGASLLGEVTDDEEVEVSDMTINIGMETGQNRPPSPTSFSYIPKSSVGGGAKFDD
jgi:hypothetical protein